MIQKPMSFTSVANFLALIEIVRHLCAGPRAIRVSIEADDEDEWLESFLRMRQSSSPPDGPFEAFSLYEVPIIIAPGRSMPVVRSLIWNRRSDRERCRTAVVRWPNVLVGYFTLEPQGLHGLDMKVRELDSALSSYRIEMSGLHLDDVHGESGSSRSAPIRHTSDQHPPMDRWLHRGMASGTIDLEFSEMTSLDFDGVWLGVWNELKAMCVDVRRVLDVKETYTFDPEDYATAITRRFK